jgi:hypothetical protein
LALLASWRFILKTNKSYGSPLSTQVTAGELNLLKSTHQLTDCGGVALVGAGVPKTWNVSDIILDLYRVTELLGEGGFGKVYSRGGSPCPPRTPAGISTWR